MGQICTKGRFCTKTLFTKGLFCIRVITNVIKKIKIEEKISYRPSVRIRVNSDSKNNNKNVTNKNYS